MEINLKHLIFCYKEHQINVKNNSKTYFIGLAAKITEQGQR